MTCVIVVAKAPVSGLAKTRLARTLGDAFAADLAAACLLDTIDAVESVTAPHTRLIALTGDLADAARAVEIQRRLSRWQVIDQRGESFAARLVNAHADAARLWGVRSPVVQIGMDTPQVTGADLMVLADAISGGGASEGRFALGPALDGGWWGLASNSATKVAAIAAVPMSRHDTGELTAQALRSTGAPVQLVHELHDVDTIDDARSVARSHPGTRFASGFAAAEDVGAR